MFEFGVLDCLWRCPLLRFISRRGVMFHIARIVFSAKLPAFHIICLILLTPGKSGAHFDPGEQPGAKSDSEF